MRGRSVRRFAFVLSLVVLASLLAAPAAFGAVTRVEEDDAAITYSAGWAPYGHVRYTDGRCMYAATAGPLATFTFSGTEIGWYSVMAPDQGLAEVWVDDGAHEVVDRWAPSYTGTIDPTRHLIVWSKSGLSNGPHTLYIRALGQRSPQTTTGATYVTIDALDVTVPDPPVVSTSSSAWWSLVLIAGFGIAALPLVRRSRVTV